MITDKLATFCNGVSVANAAGTDLVGDVLDMQNLRDLGQGNPIYLVITVETEVITGGSAGTILFQFVSDAQAAIAADATETIHFQTGTFVTDGTDATGLPVGTSIAVVALPMEGVTYERYLGIQTVIATTTVTAGAIDAFLTMDVAKWKAYADGAN